jgi:hypothetical protein
MRHGAAAVATWSRQRCNHGTAMLLRAAVGLATSCCNGDAALVSPATAMANTEVMLARMDMERQSGEGGMHNAREGSCIGAMAQRCFSGDATSGYSGDAMANGPSAVVLQARAAGVAGGQRSKIHSWFSFQGALTCWLEASWIVQIN